jgi:uroporphyrinogen decarboxylase
MTPRERILAALRHQVPDRTPTDGWFHPEVVERLKRHCRTTNWDDVLNELGICGWSHYGLSFAVPEFDARAETRTYKRMTRTGVWLDERTYRDAWGTVTRIGESGWYEEWVSGPLAGAGEPDLALAGKLDLPRPEHLVPPRECAGSLETYARRVAELKRRELFVTGGIPNPYKVAWQLRGMDRVLADYLENRDFLEALYDRLYALFGEAARRMARAGVDMLTVTGDIAMQDRIVMGPRLWREVDKPRLARLIADCRRLNPHVFLFIHSDGNVTDLMDDLVEIGFDVVNPIQPECMDPVAVKRRWGDRITLHGGVSLQRTLPNGTVEDVRAEVEELIRKCGYNGGLVVFPSNVIQPDTSVQNILACFHAARDFDVAALGGRPG